MAVINFQPDAAIAEVTAPETILEQHDSNFETLIPESKTLSLLKYVEGFPWTIHYYGQLVNKSNTLEKFDPSIINLTSPYYEIKNLILQVASPLTSNYDQATGVTTVEGTSIVPFGVTPNIGDIFLANVDSGEDAIFVINNVTRKTYRKDTIYEINYYLLYYTSTNQNFYDTLKERVQQTYYFNKDSNFFNRDNLITPEVKEASDILQTFLHQSKDYYFSSFFNRALGGLFLPHKDYKLYDPVLMDFILKTVELDYNLNRLSLYNYSNNKVVEQPSILTALIKREKSLLSIINKQYRFISTSYLSNKSRFGTLAAAGVDYFLYPLNPEDKHITNKQPALILDADTGISAITDLNTSSLTLQVETLTGNKNLLPEMFTNDYYIVSENFYNYVQEQDIVTSTAISYIELIIYKFLRAESITKKDLVIAIQEYENWDSLHQFYLLPVMWLIVRNYL